MQVRNGYMRFRRLGPITFAKQDRWSVRAPATKGLWAFPYPFFDMYFAYHKYTDLLPKRFKEADKNPMGYLTDPQWYRDRDNNVPQSLTFDGDGYLKDDLTCVFYDEQEKWINDVGKKILPIRDFWYRGDVYTHFLPNGEVGCAPMNSENPDVEWTVMGTPTLAKNISSTHADKTVWSFNGRPQVVNGSVDHLEVFIAPGMGTFRNKKDFT